jgi:hypothetical protein
MAAGFSAQQALAAVNAKTTQERSEALFGAALAGAGAAKGFKSGEAAPETAIAATERPAVAPEPPVAPETPVVPETQAAGRVEPITQRYQEPPTSGEDVQAANADAGQVSGFPEKTDFLTQESAAKPETATAVREPLTLDELRLMRERSDLQLQNDLAHRATGATHPAVDQRIAELNDELDQLANREAAPSQAAPPNEALDFARQHDDGLRQDEIATEMAKEAPSESSVPPNAAAGVEESAPTGNSSTSRANPQAAQQPGVSRPQPKLGQPTGVAEAYLKEELGDDAVIPGEGKTWQESRDYGKQFINEGGDPEAPIRVAKTSGRSGWREVGIVGAERERLSMERRKAARQLAQDPTNPQLLQGYTDAEKAQVGYIRKSQPVFTSAGSGLRATQGERIVNPASYDDLVDLAFQSMGKKVKELAPQERRALARGANDIVRIDKERVDAADKVRQEVRKQAGGKSMSLDELKNDTAKWLKEKMADCVV